MVRKIVIYNAYDEGEPAQVEACMASEDESDDGIIRSTPDADVAG